MYRNYENRVKEFVLDMTNPHSIIQHKDITEKITNTREELMNEQFADNPEKKSRTGYILKAILWMVFLITVLLVIYCAIIL